MEIKSNRLAISLVVLLMAALKPGLAADIEISGFVTIVAGRVISGDQVLSDYPKAGIYDDDISTSPDTSLGVQLQTELIENIGFVVQAVSHGAQDYSPEIDWAYVNIRVNDELSTQIGRKRLPLYYYSDHFDIAYTYLWVRPPADNYTWQISNYNGISLNYEPRVNEWDVLINVYTGNETSNDNELLSELSGNSVDETWKNLIGIAGEFSKSDIDYRVTFLHSQLERKINGYIIEKNTNQQFLGVSVNIHPGEFSLLSELNRYQRPASNIKVDTGLLSIAYQLGDFTPYISYSKLKQHENRAGGDEEHSTSSLGVRWDVANNTALKIQYDKIEDKAELLKIFGDGELISVSLDYVF